MVRLRIGLLSLGVFLIIVAVWIAALISGIIIVENLISMILLSCGLWIVVVAGFKAFMMKQPDGAFSIFGWGTLLIVVGGSLYMVSMGMNPVYTVVFVLAIIGALTVIATVRSTRD